MNDQRKTFFFSYSRDDKPVVEPLVMFLASADVHVLWDGAIEPGQLWEDVLLDWLDTADQAYAVWSKNAANSDWVDLELDLLVSQSTKIIPLMLDDTPLPDALRSRQGIPFGGVLGKWTRVGAAGAAQINIDSRQVGLALDALLSGDDTDSILTRIDAFTLSATLSDVGLDHPRDTVRAIVSNYGNRSRQ